MKISYTCWQIYVGSTVDKFSISSLFYKSACGAGDWDNFSNLDIKEYGLGALFFSFLMFNSAHV